MNTIMIRRARIGAQIKRLRKDRGLSQRDLAKAIQRDAPFVSRVESGQRPISADLLIAVCDVLGFDLVLRPRQPPEAARNSAKFEDFVRVTLEAAAAPRPSDTRPGGVPGAGSAVTDQALATMLAALADEYEGADVRTRESLRIRFWHAYPDLRR